MFATQLKVITNVGNTISVIRKDRICRIPDGMTQDNTG